MKDSLSQLSDTLNTVTDTLSSINSDDVLNRLTFDISNVINNNGIIISVVGYVVVFSALLILYISFSSLTKILIHRQRKRLKSAGADSDLSKEHLSVSGEINAAIGMALYLHFSELHDFENTVLTIKKVQKTYSPWSSKIYGLREYPKRK
jgi:glutaconyl-CoA/methylmalonyl-CoA decarboxylase subunit delta